MEIKNYSEIRCEFVNRSGHIENLTLAVILYLKGFQN